MVKQGDVIARQDAGQHVLFATDKATGIEHTYPLHAATPEERKVEARAILRALPYAWTNAYDASRRSA